MSDFSDFKLQIAEWANRGDWSDGLVTSFIRSAEEKFNQDLLIDRMMKVTINTVDHSCADLPDDWLKADFMLIQATNTPYGWTPIKYHASRRVLPLLRVRTTRPLAATRFAVARSISAARSTPSMARRFGCTITLKCRCSRTTRIAGCTPSIQALYRYAALMHADLHAVGEEMTAAGLKMLVDDEITKLNNQHLLAKASGSRVKQKPYAELRLNADFQSMDRDGWVRNDADQPSHQHGAAHRRDGEHSSGCRPRSVRRSV